MMTNPVDILESVLKQCAAELDTDSINKLREYCQSKPKRIQRKRVKGWKMPPNTIYIGRGSRFGNPFIIGKDGTRQECIDKFISYFLPYTHNGPNNTLEDFMISEANIKEIISSLRGYDICCWCKESEPCHGDFLLEIANMIID